MLGNKPRLFHDLPETPDIKNSNEFALVQNLDSQPSYTLFFISENYQLLSRSETSKIQRNFETYFASVMFWQPSGNTTHQKFKWVRIVTKPGYIVSHLTHCLSSQKKKNQLRAETPKIQRKFQSYFASVVFWREPSANYCSDTLMLATRWHLYNQLLLWMFCRSSVCRSSTFYSLPDIYLICRHALIVFLIFAPHTLDFYSFYAN